MTYPAFISDSIASIRRVMLPGTGGKGALRMAADAALRVGLWCEFGVASGHTLRILAERRGLARLVGFDSFAGLPRAWYDMPAGGFACEKPEVPGAEIVVGLFADVLPTFDDHGDTVNLLHIDCDLYESAATVLEWAQPRLKPGSMVVFDELAGYPDFADHEMKALYEAHERGLRWEWCFARDFNEVAVSIL